jgi:hypothetical protein
VQALRPPDSGGRRVLGFELHLGGEDPLPSASTFVPAAKASSTAQWALANSIRDS